MEIEQLPELLEGKETHSKKGLWVFFISIILNIQMNDPINLRPLCPVSPSLASPCAPAAGPAAQPCTKQSAAMRTLAPRSLQPLGGCHAPALLSLPGHRVQSISAPDARGASP